MIKLPQNTPRKKLIFRVIIALLIIIVSFPAFDLSYTIGIDSPHKWIYNYLFDTGLKAGRDILFTHGPLAFFMYPLQENLITAILITGLLRIGFILGMFKLAEDYGKNDVLLPIFVSVILINLFEFNILILANLALVYLNYYNTRKEYYKYTGYLLTVFACYLKTHTAVISVSVTASFILIELIRGRNWKHSLRDIMVLFLGLYISWFLMFYSLTGFFRYFYGILNLGMDHSAAAAYYPENNWILITIFLCTVILLPFLQKTREGRYFGLLFMLSIFLAWKHGMAREDVHHSRAFFIYIFMLMTLFLLFNKKKTLFNFIILTIGLSAYYLNITNLPSYVPKKIEFFGINNLADLITDYEVITGNASAATEKNLVSNKLPEQVKIQIGESATDIYPWDYSIIPANNLNWRPRPAIQSFLSYNSWLDNQNAKHFDSGSSPEYIIWDLDKLTADLNGGSAEGLDNRYLLNDEPNTIIRMICNYQAIYKDRSFLVLNKRNTPIEVRSYSTEPFISEWDQWIDIPDKSGELLRAHVAIKNNLAGRIKSFLYKDESSWIYCRFSNGEIVKYKIVPKNAQDGIWLDPFIFQMESNLRYPEIKSIMFKCSDRRFLKDPVEINWDFMSFEDNTDSTVFSFFRKDSTLVKKQLLYCKNSFEGDEFLSNPVDANQFSPESFTGSTGYRVVPGSFSPGFEILLDSLGTGQVKISTGLWVKGRRADSPFVISIETKKEGVVEWHAVNMRDQMIGNEGWNHVYNHLTWDLSDDAKESLLKVYLINESQKELIIDDISVRIVRNPEPPQGSG